VTTTVRGWAARSRKVVLNVRAGSSSSAGGSAAMPWETSVRQRSTGSPAGPVSGRTSDIATAHLLYDSVVARILLLGWDAGGRR
jgi:hypothetical protein